MVAISSPAPLVPRWGKVRDWYSNLVSAGPSVPVFLLVWSSIVSFPLLVVVFFSFLPIRSYRVVY